MTIKQRIEKLAQGVERVRVGPLQRPDAVSQGHRSARAAMRRSSSVVSKVRR